MTRFSRFSFFAVFGCAPHSVRVPEIPIGAWDEVEYITMMDPGWDAETALRTVSSHLGWGEVDVWRAPPDACAGWGRAGVHVAAWFWTIDAGDGDIIEGTACCDGERCAMRF